MSDDVERLRREILKERREAMLHAIEEGSSCLCDDRRQHRDALITAYTEAVERRARAGMMDILRESCFAVKLPVAAGSKVRLWGEVERRLALLQGAEG